MKFRQQLQWNHQYQSDPRRNYGEKRRKSCHFKIKLIFIVIIEYQKRDTEWFSRYQTHPKNTPAKSKKFPRHSDRVEANQEYRRRSSPSCIVAAPKRVQRAIRKQLTPGISQSPMPTINWLGRHYEASNCYQVGGYDTNHESLATTNFDPFQTNFLDPRSLSNANLRITSNMLSPDIEPSFPRQCPANFPLEHWPFHALQRSFPMSSSTLNLDINDQLSSDAVPFDAFRTTMCDLRASLDANLPITSSTLDSDHLRAPYLGDCSTDIPSRHSHFEASQTTLPMTSSLLDSDLRAPYLGDCSTDIPPRHSHFEASQTTLPMTSSVLDSDLRAPYLGDYSMDVSSRNSQFEGSQANFLITSSRLDPDLRVPCLGNFRADIPARSSQLDASLTSFSTTSSIPDFDLSPSLENRPATTTATSSFQMGFPDPWIVSDPSSSMTSNIQDSDLRAPYFGNYPMDLPTRLSQFEHSSTSFSTTSNILNLDLRAPCVGIPAPSLPAESLAELDYNWES